VIGQTVAHYKVTAKLGAGGMGEVYRATDTKLGRDVALKVLPQAVAGDAQRMARFQREAQVLASLNHPNIAAIYGLEEAGATSSDPTGTAPRALVMELVDGPTLAERIAQGAIPLDEALPIAKQIAEALEYAHERGIIHRDLKPANIKLTPDGKVKVLDFGLAKALAADSSLQDASNSPTISMAATKAGIILGTAAYMSPEQARGRPVDKRADIWAFGVVLYEVLAGRQAYGGETASDSMAAVITREPDWSALPPTMPPRLNALLRRCLTKDEKRRLRDIGEARLALDEETLSSSQAAQPLPVREAARPRRWRQILPWVIAAALAVALLATNRSRQELTRGTARFALNIPADLTHGRAISISPDGKAIAFIGEVSGLAQLYIRRLDQIEPQPLAGAILVRAHFFSPDGKWIGFTTSDRKLKKVSVVDGALLTLGDAPLAVGGSWGVDDRIILASVGAGLGETTASGGELKPLTMLDAAKGEAGHVWPLILPNGNAVLFTRRPRDEAAETVIEALDLKTGKRRMVIRDATCPSYAATGHLLFARGGALLAAPFDPERLEVTGPEIKVLDEIFSGQDGSVKMALSANGTLVYVTKRWAKLVWVDQEGKAQILKEVSRGFSSARLSPDDRRLVITDSGQLWLMDLERDSLSRFAVPVGGFPFPSWTPKGDRIAYTSGLDIAWQPTDGSGPAEILVGEPPVWKGIGSFTPDGSEVAYVALNTGTGGDIYIQRTTGKREIRPFLNSPAFEGGAQFSPSGRYMAYVSDETGQREVYVTTYPNPGAKWRISNDGGTQPLWSVDGRRLYYRFSDAVLVADTSEAGGFRASKPRLLFRGEYGYGLNITLPSYGFTRDGRKFVMIQDDTTVRGGIRIVENWFEELRRATGGTTR
jgi:Tol biopolymer transport system component